MPRVKGAAKRDRAGTAKSYTPVMQQFLRAKAEYPDTFLFFRLGDFYELFFTDAERASELLGLALTSRGTDPSGAPIPMAGVPHHSATSYITRLLSLGHRVALCEQMADPSTVSGVVPREVVRVITPGLCLEEDALDARADNYLVAVATRLEGRAELHSSPPIGLAAFELSTAQLLACELADEASLLAELVRLDPREVLFPPELESLAAALSAHAPRSTVRVGPPPPNPAAALEAILGDAVRAELAASVGDIGLEAAGRALSYAQSTQPNTAISVQRAGVFDTSRHLVLDETAVRSLELVATLDGERRGSLLHHLDRTRTPMGARLLRRRVLAPFADIASIRRVQDAVESLYLDPQVRRALREALAGSGDLERLTTRAALGVATPRDLGRIRSALQAAAQVVEVLEGRAKTTADDPLRIDIPADPCRDLLEVLDRSLAEELPVVDRQGGIFREGIDEDLDAQRRLAADSKDVIQELELRERERTGIGSLRVKYTRVFGYYIEVTRSNLDAVPDDYVRKQTVANAERFVTEELAELADRILHAEDRAVAREQALFADLHQRVAREALRLRTLSEGLAALDVHAALADAAHEYGYVRPLVDDSLLLDIVEGRHPIVERLAAAGSFVPNDVRLDTDGARLMIVTGPNMAGKSTAMRKVALSVILAQIGGFIPAKAGRIGLVDRIFSRVGASDNLSQGKSTFMVEMVETATILSRATRRSLVILDEIGRGTSTYDGLSIAWAVAEHLHDAIRCRTMFATHYHELCELTKSREGAMNFNVAAEEVGEDIVFLHKLVRGGASRSYGVAVARLAGLPRIVVARASAILRSLEGGDPLPSGAPSRARPNESFAAAPQLDLFVGSEGRLPPSEIEATLRELDIEHMTPVEALVALARLKDMLK